MKKTIIRALAILGAATFTLVGCSIQKQDDRAGLTLGEDGEVRGVIIDDFDESLYSVSELQEMINSEVSEYNAATGAGRITAEDAVVEDGKVKVVMQYMSTDDYVAFNNRRLELTNLKDALDSNMLNVGFVEAGKNDPFELEKVDEPNLYTVIITDEPGNLSCPGNIAYYSGGVSLENKKQVVVSEDMDGLAYIIYRSK